MFALLLVLFSFADSHNNMRAVSAVENEKTFLTENYNDLVDFQPIGAWQVRRAQMQVLKSDDPQSIEQVELVEKSHGERLSYELKLNNKIIVFQPQRIYKAACGERIVEALSVQGNEYINLTLVDASGFRPCKDRVIYEWQAEFSSSIQNIEMQYNFVGNPY